MDVFYYNICFTCKATSKDCNLRDCTNCGMVSYCSKEHQRQHLKIHKKLCTIIKQVTDMTTPDNLNSKESWYKYRTNFMMVCECLLGRKLFADEMNMLLFPRNCEVCHSRSGLTDCDECLCVSYCSSEHRLADANNHVNLCDKLALGRHLDLLMNKQHPSYQICDKKSSNMCKDMQTFLSCNIRVENKIAGFLEASLVSELVTCPLSMLFGLSLISFNMPSQAVIHVIGSGALESLSLKSWEMVLHICQEVQELKVVFIGPETLESEAGDLCVACRGARLSFEFSTSLYHEFVASEGYVTPDAVCVFNCGLHEFEGSESDTWKDSLSSLASQDRPVVLTSFTKDEAVKDVRRLTALNPRLITRTVENPYASLRPYRDLENLGVYFNNNYLSVIN